MQDVYLSDKNRLVLILDCFEVTFMNHVCICVLYCHLFYSLLLFLSSLWVRQGAT